MKITTKTEYEWLREIQARLKYTRVKISQSTRLLNVSALVQDALKKAKKEVQDLENMERFLKGFKS